MLITWPVPCSFWKKNSSLDDLLKVSEEVQNAAWALQKKSGKPRLLHPFTHSLHFKLLFQFNREDIAECFLSIEPPKANSVRCFKVVKL